MLRLSSADRSKVIDDEVTFSFKKPTSPKSEKYIESIRESRNRSESCEKVANKRRRYNSPSHSHEPTSRQDKDSKNTHIRFADEEITGKPFQHFDEADSTTSSGDKEELSSSSSGKKGSGGSKERKKGILKKKKKNGGKGSILGISAAFAPNYTTLVILKFILGVLQQVFIF